MRVPPIILTIAGFDPGSGAGITADIKTIAAHGCYGVACITALTVQSTRGVSRVQPVTAAIIEETLSELAQDVSFAAVHIGMLGSAEAAETAAGFLTTYRPPNVVLDPVLNSTSGATLLEPDGMSVLIKRLLPLASVITPNLVEASIITGLPVTDRNQMLLAADQLHRMGAQAVVITGGHLESPTDLLSFRNEAVYTQQFFDSPKIASNSTHGTGCAFSTALTCHLAQGATLVEAIKASQEFVRSAISEAQAIGKGTGPINHLYRLRKG